VQRRAAAHYRRESDRLEADHSIATLKRVKNQPGVNGVKNIIAVSSARAGWVNPLPR
jgi:hypothetical protein